MLEAIVSKINALVYDGTGLHIGLKSQYFVYFFAICGIIPVLWTAIYCLSNLYMKLAGPVNLKKKYNAKWALVTGASSGIGRELSKVLASQGLSVVLVALADNDKTPPHMSLNTILDELKSTYKGQEFRKIEASFNYGVDYMPAIIDGTKDIDVQLIFNNAGFIVSGFFDTTTLNAQLNNLECNTTSCVKVTHHFLQLLIQKELKGCIMFTSSVSGYFPNPFAIMYGATKAFVSQFAASLAIEVRAKGIDVLAVHPSPVASNFFNSVTHKIDALDMAKKAAVSPATVPKLMLSCVGRSHLGDLGGTAFFMRFFAAILPMDFLTGLISSVAPNLPDYQRNNKNRGSGGKKLD